MRADAVRTRERGFTLLEVLVATAIFAVAAIGLLNAQSTQIRTDQHLETKTVAHWVAVNHLADLQLKKQFPDVGETRTTETMAGREWQLVTRAQSTPTANVRLLVVSVAEKPSDFAKQGTPVTQVTGFISRAAANAASD
ncbi:MAG: ral secretion pathway protein [Moraxellaceae bacterium]|jgi:general secretion pathway protein I|nr:ral secretion pathway protein [Moraxellaceae bacterium]